MTFRSIRYESPGRDRLCVLSCSRFFNKSSGCAARQETTPALNPAILSTRDADKGLLGAFARFVLSFCSTGGNARGIAGSDGRQSKPARTSSDLLGSGRHCVGEVKDAISWLLSRGGADAANNRGGEKLSDVDSVEAWTCHRNDPRTARVGYVIWCIAAHCRHSKAWSTLRRSAGAAHMNLLHIKTRNEHLAEVNAAFTL